MVTCLVRLVHKHIQISIFGVGIIVFFKMQCHVANEPCDAACSFACAVVSGQEQCYCPVGMQLNMAGGTQCIGEFSLFSNFFSSCS